MADVVTERSTIRTSKQACLAVLLDFEQYPAWARDLKTVTVLERDDQGRGRRVRYRAAGMGYSTSYTLVYDHGDPDRLAWRLVEGDLARKLDGHYAFAPTGGDPEQEVEVSYELEVELILPIPGFVKRRTQLKIMHTALRELQARVEARPGA